MFAEIAPRLETATEAAGSAQRVFLNLVAARPIE
jgi:hypothetical protein